ncbi:hypothetical protein OG500_07160 [Kitasatospora sp. NBC_01250]|uniref:hypothetical protein n=1 Tax=unclassified Kitasatospora TaxID=2633591 RepID=UPI002E122540|nr:MULTISPECIES: hypothetical protein [unclassified Kitasatospora]WSJ65885.1 hypothetical protein OG294_07030 [Kitasatospora sp. NBC_01302]
MPAAEQRAVGADSTLMSHEEPEGDDLVPGFGHIPGTDPGEAETWEIIRVHCPECDRPIALLGDEEQLPQHAVLRTAWHPFSPALCAGSGLPAEDLAECEPEPGAEPADALDALLTLPAELDWRTQPFSHVGGAGSLPLQRTA